MLLSFYASFRWARKRDYALKMCVFIVLVSFLSTLFPWPGVLLMWLFFPFAFLSFPFYFWYSTLFPPPGVSQEILERSATPWWWLEYRVIRFLTEDITFAPNFEVSGGRIQTYGVWSNYNNALVIAFVFFLLVNVVGAFLGYWLSKKIRIQFLVSRWWKILSAIVAIVGITCIILGWRVISSHFMPFHQTERVASLIIGIGTFMLEIILLQLLDKAAEFWENIEKGEYY